MEMQTGDVSESCARMCVNKVESRINQKKDANKLLDGAVFLEIIFLDAEMKKFWNA